MARRKRTGNVDQSQSYGFAGETIVAGEDVLNSLGVAQFTCPANQDKTAKLHEFFLLPAHKEDSERYGLDLFIHYSVGINNASVLCPRLMKQVFEVYGITVPKEYEDGKCPVCKLADRLQQKSNEMQKSVGEEEGREFWKENVAPLRSYYGKTTNPEPNRHLMWVRNADDESDEENIQFFLSPLGVYKECILKKTKDRRSGKTIDLADPDNPYIMYFERKGEGLLTKYEGCGAEAYEEDDGTAIPMPDAWFDNVPRYTDILNFKTYDEIKEIMGDEDVVETTSDAKKESDEFFEKDFKDAEEKKTRRRRKVIDPDDEDIVPENTDEDIDEVKERVGNRRRKRKAQTAEA